MRLGECLGLKYENLYETHIHVCHNWHERYGLGETKTGKSRDIPITEELYDLLRGLSIKRESYIFRFKNNLNPVDRKTIYKWSYRAMAKIGISKEERKERNITFHSWRHFFNSKLRAAGIPDSIVMSLVGHSDLKMTNHYTHFRIEDMEDVKNVIEGMR